VDIHSRIMQELADFETTTGKKPKRIYLGRNEMKALILWAYDNQYVFSPDLNVEGEYRPEVGGVLCWHVNDDDHLVCA
jgi:hypothetical protein